MWVVLFATKNKRPDDLRYYFICVAFSLTIKSGYEAFYHVATDGGELPPAAGLAVSVVVALALSLAVALLSLNKKANKVLVDLFSRTLNHDIWVDAIDFDEGCVVSITTKNNETYTGCFDMLSEDCKWITLTRYVVHDAEKNHRFSYDSTNNGSLLIIRMDDIKDCRILYSESSKKGEYILSKG